jgi:hypothetical protein
MSNLETQPKINSNNKRNNIIVIVLSVILVAVVVLFFIQRKEHSVIIKTMKVEKDSIQSELTQLVEGYDLLKTENDTINEQLLVAQTKVRDLLIEVEQTKKVSFEKIASYQKQVTSLRGVLRDFVAQVDSLNRRNQQLMEENTQVKEQFKKVEIQNEQLSQDKEKLERNLQRAAQLEARELLAEGINSRGKETRFARKAEMIRISFILGKNVTSKRGPKNIYARILRPDQQLMTKSDKDLFQFEDLKIPFSAMREVTYEGQDLPVAIYWDNTGESGFVVGNYTIDLFADGNNIGTTTVELK